MTTSTITASMNVGEAQVRAIFENPTASNKGVLAVVQRTHPGRGTDKTVAWYRAHAKQCLAGKPGALGKDLAAVARSYGRPVPAAASAPAGAPAAPAPRTLEQVDEDLLVE